MSYTLIRAFQLFTVCILPEGDITRMLKGVLFDLGDTLQRYRVEDWEEIQRMMNTELYNFLASSGHAAHLPPMDEFLELINTTTQAYWEEVRQTRRGRPMTALLEPLLERHGIEGLRAEECLAPWYNSATDYIYIEPDVKPTLELLHDGGLKLAVVSNTSWPAAAHDPDLERFGIKHLLDCRIYSCEVGWEKPAPQIFHAALDCLGIGPQEAVMVGDWLRYDVAGAHAVGMQGIWRRIEGRPDEVDDTSVVPDAVITSIGELPAVLQRLFGWHAAAPRLH
jgi:FMN phosphatase YigB (HAD superfamily)